ncbi:MAG: glycosyltransferase [Anaerolineae bacterium]|nr:glycosyltransferase [Anaerolineae bacterium]NIN95821.1 glycosyltransferase [Anaerolineae bacterium]NIQ78787.1 glycosyltransferase [Anaerolineae bacterium]
MTSMRKSEPEAVDNSGPLSRWFEWVSHGCEGPQPLPPLPEAVRLHTRRRRKEVLAALETPSEAQVCDTLRRQFPSGLTCALVSYHTNPLYAIRERVRDEEGVDIDPFDQGGQGTYQERLSFELAEGFDVRVLTFTMARSFLTRQQYLNIHPSAPVVPVPHSGQFVEDASGLVKKENIYFIIDELVDNTVEYLVDHALEVDFFSGHYATGMAAVRRLSRKYGDAMERTVPYSATTHSLGWDRFLATYDVYTQQELARFNFDRRLEEEMVSMQGADAVITVAPGEVETVTHPGLYNVPRDRVVTIPGGVDTQVFRPYRAGEDWDAVTALRSRHKLTEGDRLILVIGRLWDYRRKGVDITLEAFAGARRVMGARAKSLRLALVGVPPSEDATGKWGRLRVEVEELVAKSGVQDSTLLVEMIPHEVVPAWLHFTALSGGVVLALPRVEPWGLMNLEAMATGNVVVTIDKGGPPNYIESGHNGLLVNRDDPAGTIQALAQVLSDDELADRMRKNAHITASTQHSWADVARRFLWAHLRVMDAGSP